MIDAMDHGARIENENIQVFFTSHCFLDDVV
jgi:hypothetical protein